MTDRDDRAARLAEQLRANLRRRKAQARAVRDEALALEPASTPELPRREPE
jgi:hypothetical protein